MSSYRLGLFVLLAISLSALTGSSQTPTATEVHVLSSMPAGHEATAHDLRSGIRITFDRDMVRPDEVGKVVTHPTFEIVPTVTGESRWVDLRTLAFLPKSPLQSSTTYQVKLSPKFTPGIHRPATWPGLSFVYDRIRVINQALDGNSRFSSTQPMVQLTLSQASSSTNVLAACSFCETRTNISGPCTRAVIAPAKTRTSETGLHFALSPESPLRRETAYRFHCQAGLLPQAGDAGTLKDADRSFTTFGSAKIAKVEPMGNAIAADHTRVSITFTTPVDPNLVRKHVELVDDQGQTKAMELSGNWDRTKYEWSGNLKVDTGYSIRITPGLVDVFGQSLPSGTVHNFAVGNLSTKLRMERGIFVVERSLGRYPVWTRNLDSFKIRCAEIPESRLTAVLTGPANYDAWWDASGRGEIDYKGLRLGERQKTIRTRNVRNQWHDASLNLGEICGNRAKSGIYILEASAEDAMGKPLQDERRSLASVTDLGLVAKVGNASSLLWVVSLSTGKPVVNATVKIRDLKGKVRFEGITNADGIAQGPGATLLTGVKPRKANVESDEVSMSTFFEGSRITKFEGCEVTGIRLRLQGQNSKAPSRFRR